MLGCKGLTKAIMDFLIDTQLKISLYYIINVIFSSKLVFKDIIGNNKINIHGKVSFNLRYTFAQQTKL